MKRIIRILIIGQVDKSILKDLRKNIEIKFQEFNISVDPQIETISLEDSYYNKKRGQYNTLKILKKIELFLQNKQYFRALGIIEQDIYANSLNFVFGLAMSPKTETPKIPLGALISITRLRESFYRRPEDLVLFKQRILKEAVHELGHTFGLPHCNKFCIMRFSNSLADTDDKPSSFCNSCLVNLRNFFDKLETSF